MDDERYELQALVDRTGVTARTIRYYIQQGLLRSPGFGPTASYDRGHLLRLHLIRLLQREHHTLAEIKEQLGGMSDEDLESVLRGAPYPGMASDSSRRGREDGSAADYVRSVLGGSKRPPSAGSPSPVKRSQWERLSLSPGLELHVQRPLSGDEQRLLDRLLEEVRQFHSKP